MSKKVQVEFSDSAMERIKSIADATEAASNAEVVRNALQLFDWFIRKRLEGYAIHLIRDDEELAVELPVLEAPRKLVGQGM